MGLAVLSGQVLDGTATQPVEIPADCDLADGGGGDVLPGDVADDLLAEERLLLLRDDDGGDGGGSSLFFGAGAATASGGAAAAAGSAGDGAGRGEGGDGAALDGAAGAVEESDAVDDPPGVAPDDEVRDDVQFAFGVGDCHGLVLTMPLGKLLNRHNLSQ